MLNQPEKSGQFLMDYRNFNVQYMNRFEQFFREFYTLKSSLAKNHWDEQHFKLEMLINRYRNDRKRIRDMIRKNADEYNIFNILKVNILEAITHTPFLTDLLNPEGTHGQRELFLKKFINSAFPHQGYLNHFDPGYIYIQDELATIKGKIDIFIHHYKMDNPFTIIIENKIFAPDQDKQMERYWEYASKILKIEPDQIGLVYLKDGSRPSHSSMDPDFQDKLIRKGNLACMSYNPELINLLKSTLDEIHASNVRLLIEQYLQTIKDFRHEHL